MTSWNDPASWVGGVVPGPADDGEIIGTVTVSGNVACCKLVAPVGTTLVFDPTHSTKITACGSVIMEGTLQWHPANASIVHEILFVGIDESLFVGGTVDPHTNGHSGHRALGHGRGAPRHHRHHEDHVGAQQHRVGCDVGDDGSHDGRADRGGRLRHRPECDHWLSSVREKLSGSRRDQRRRHLPCRSVQPHAQLPDRRHRRRWTVSGN